MSDIKVSIIVPVYNVLDSILRQCIESTLNQTLKDIEIILVDDGSTNDSGKICDEYRNIDERIKVIHKKNGGLAAARNTGYQNATGDWITFLDSDDWIDSHTCEDTYKLGVNNQADVVIFGTIQEFERYKNVFKYHYKNGEIFEGVKCKELQCEILNFSGNIATAWAKLFKKKFLDNNNLTHNAELRQGSEGIEFNIRVFENVQKVYFTDNIYYHYIFNPNSISAKHDEKNHYLVIKCFEEIQKDIELSNNKEALKKMFYNRFAYVVVAATISGYFSPTNRQNYREKICSFNEYRDNKLVKSTMKKCNPKQLGISRRIVITLIETKSYLIIWVLSKIRYALKHR